jgi:hypothetical protein
MSNPDPMVSAQVQSFIRKIILAAVVYAVGAGVQRGWIPSGQAAMLTEVLTVIGTVVGLQLWSNFNDRVLYQTTPPNNGPAPGSGPGAPPPWHPGSVNGLLVAGATLGLLAASLGVGGCAGLTDTNPVRQTADNIQTATMGTQKLTRVGQEQGSLNIDGSLPTYSSLLDFVSREVGVDGDGRPVYKAFPRVDSTGGGASHEMVMPIGPHGQGHDRPGRHMADRGLGRQLGRGHGQQERCGRGGGPGPHLGDLERGQAGGGAGGGQGVA